MSDRGKPRSAEDYPDAEDIIAAYAKSLQLPPADEGSFSLDDDAIPQNEYHPLVIYLVYSGDSDTGWLPFLQADSPYQHTMAHKPERLVAALMLLCAELDSLVAPIRKENS